MIRMQGSTCAAVASEERVEETVVSVCFNLIDRSGVDEVVYVHDSFTSLFLVYDSFLFCLMFFNACWKTNTSGIWMHEMKVYL